MHPLADLFLRHEDRLMRRILDYAKRCGYTRYTSTLEEAWRLSISGLTASLIQAMKEHDDVPELTPQDDYTEDPLAEFGVIEAKRHRQRGVTLAMFLGLMKYYRQSYVDLLEEESTSPDQLRQDRLYLNRCFDRIEVAFCQEWVSVRGEEIVGELQTANRYMTNEKNTYLTIFESLSDPVIMLDLDERVVNLNNAASLLVNPAHIPGGHYYQLEPQKDGASPYGKFDIDSACIGHPVSAVFPWLAPTLRIIHDHQDTFECEVTVLDQPRLFEVKRSDMLDVSEKLTSTVIILRDITNRKRTENELRDTVRDLGKALSEVKRLTGLLPICASCKKVRDDQGYWQKVENYIAARTEATFSHGICPECLKKHYPNHIVPVDPQPRKQKGSR